MSDIYLEYAKLFKERDNVSKIGITVGTVTAVDEFKIKRVDIHGGIVVCGKKMVLSQVVSNYKNDIGDLVIVVSNESNSRFFVIDKVGGA